MYYLWDKLMPWFIGALIAAGLFLFVYFVTKSPSFDAERYGKDMICIEEKPGWNFNEITKTCYFLKPIK